VEHLFRGSHHDFWSPNWRMLLQAHPNVLIRAAAPAATTLVAALTLGLREPVQVQEEWNRASAPMHGTLVLYGVDTLGWREQLEVLAWLDATDGAVQVVSVGNDRIFPLVQRGDFLETLYYRLNTLLVDTREG
jgi:hypothetical protein